MPIHRMHEAWFGYAELCLFPLGPRKRSTGKSRPARCSIISGASTDPYLAEKSRPCPALLLPVDDDDLGKVGRPRSTGPVAAQGGRSPTGSSDTFCSPGVFPSIGRAGWTQRPSSVMQGEASKVMGPAPPPDSGLWLNTVRGRTMEGAPIALQRPFVAFRLDCPSGRTSRDVLDIPYPSAVKPQAMIPGRTCRCFPPAEYQPHDNVEADLRCWRTVSSGDSMPATARLYFRLPSRPIPDLSEELTREWP